MYMVWDVSEIYQILMSIFNGTDSMCIQLKDFMF